MEKVQRIAGNALQIILGNQSGQGSPPSAPGYGWVGDLRLDLPVDEDDYLMPSPQPSGLATVGPSHQHYMDLMADGTDGRRGDVARGACKGSSNNGVAGQQWVGMDNPEYHMMNARAQMYAGRRLHPQQTVGVPVLDAAGRCAGYGNGLPHQPQHFVPGQHLPSPSQEMPHEYYNELSSHAPHASSSRSETTV